jgi:hypothetical protein
LTPIQHLTYNHDNPETVARLLATGEPEVFTVEGGGALVVMAVGTYRALLDEVERAAAITAFRQGRAEFDARSERIPAAYAASDQADGAVHPRRARRGD